MTTFPPVSPRLDKCSLIAIDQGTKQRTEIQFQYNPETLTPQLTAQTASGSYDRSEAFRFKRPPEETHSLETNLDVATSALSEPRLGHDFSSVGVYAIRRRLSRRERCAVAFATKPITK